MKQKFLVSKKNFINLKQLKEGYAHDISNEGDL